MPIFNKFLDKKFEISTQEIEIALKEGMFKTNKIKTMFETVKIIIIF